MRSYLLAVAVMLYEEEVTTIFLLCFVDCRSTISKGICIKFIVSKSTKYLKEFPTWSSTVW